MVTYGLTIDERKRQCSYCGGKVYKTHEEFRKHWERCPVRVKAGYARAAPQAPDAEDTAHE